MLVNEQIGNIRWKYVEGGKKMHTFISKPICEEEAEESKRAIKDSFARHSQALFGDITVKATIILSRCIKTQHCCSTSLLVFLIISRW
jgi:hypothetical protein